MKAYHDSRDTVYRSPFGVVRPGTTVQVSIDVWDAPEASVMLRSWTEGQGEHLEPMAPQPLAGETPDDGRARYSATLKPEVAGVVWYQFVITGQDGARTRYGARDGRVGGVGQLVDWEPGSFQLTVYEPNADTKASDAVLFMTDFALERTYGQAIVDFASGSVTAYDAVEALEAWQESCPPSLAAQAIDVVGAEDRAGLLGRFADVDISDAPEKGVAGLEEWQLGQARGRLWRASLVQLFSQGLGLAQVQQDVHAWKEVDSVCRDIVRNVAELWDALEDGLRGIDGSADAGKAKAKRKASQPEGAVLPVARFNAANENVLAIWRDDAECERDKGALPRTVCVLVNMSENESYDVAVPMAGQSVSEVTGGYGVPVIDASQVAGLPCAGSKAEKYARIHLGQGGSAVLFFHPEERLQRSATPGVGVLAHITSLPATGEWGDGAEGQSVDIDSDRDESEQRGFGTLGASARAFVDWLARAGVRYWQVLPVNPTDGFGSPYAGISAFAGNTQLTDAEEPLPVDADEEFRAFCEREADWLEPYACFMAIRQKQGANKEWQDWPKTYRRFSARVVEKSKELSAYAEGWRRAQFRFDCQWKALRAYANERGIQIIGDMPIYVSSNSVDVWANPRIFQLGDDGRPQVVAGCPPDAFAEEGQKWGNPLYDWDVIAADGYVWWLRRLERAFELYDYVRLDHFIGFSRYFSIPADQKAIYGEYYPGPGAKLFKAAYAKFGPLPIIAEDLGSLTPAIHALGAVCGFPGMDVVQFVDGGDPLARYSPRPNKVVYTGTHDNQTLVGYALERYPDHDAREVANELMQAAAKSSAALCIVPLQDVMGLDDEARMNVPGVAQGNWAWQADSLGILQAQEATRELVQLHDGKDADHGNR